MRAKTAIIAVFILTIFSSVASGSSITDRYRQPIGFADSGCGSLTGFGNTKAMSKFEEEKRLKLILPKKGKNKLQGNSPVYIPQMHLPSLK